MKLEKAVECGYVCGLNSIEECICNIEHHAMSIFKYDEIAEELRELGREYGEYLAGNLVFDIDAIRKKVDEEMEKFFSEQEELSQEDMITMDEFLNE